MAAFIFRKVMTAALVALLMSLYIVISSGGGDGEDAAMGAWYLFALALWGTIVFVLPVSLLAVIVTHRLNGVRAIVYSALIHVIPGGIGLLFPGELASWLLTSSMLFLIVDLLVKKPVHITEERFFELLGRLYSNRFIS